LPGSRRQELRRHLGPFQAAAAALHAARPGARFTWVVPEELAGALPQGLAVAHSLDAVHDARGALSKSGTVTLELAARGIPLVVAHRVHPLTHWLARRLVTGVDHIALPNLLDPAHPVPEHVQELDPATLARALLDLPEVQPVDLQAARGPDAVARMVEQVVDCWAAQP
jgi:lipid-A-disaccharide synthase